MMRALYSGVAGLKTHMTRLDVIGNNIANVNTYGFKSSRATFRDMFYQQIRGASDGTQTRGGINPSSIGYGSQLSSVDLMMSQSGFTSTGCSLDVAITGEGFLQVQDADGNIYYTKAGMLDIDRQGRLVDTNGNFVLGTSATSGKLNSSEPGRSIISITVDPVEPAYPLLETTVLGKPLRITSDVQSNLGNVSFTISSSTKRSDGTPFYDGDPLEVIMENGSPNIAIRLSENYHFSSMEELSQAINEQIRIANGGAYEGGNFTFELDGFPENGATGGEIAVSNDNSKPGSAEINPGVLWEGVSFVDTFSAGFTGDGEITQITATNAGGVVTFEVTIDDGNGGTMTYSGETSASVSDSGALIRLYKDGNSANSTDYMGLSISKTAYDRFTGADGTTPFPDTALAAIGTANPATQSTSLGLGKQTWTLEGGTEGGPQSYENLTGISIGADGTLVGSHPVHGRLVLGRIDLANFANPMGLAQSGNSYFTETANSGKPNFAVPGEDGTGAIKNSALEMSNVDLAQEFSDMIITQRGYQANSRIITVSDQVLEELVNLKR